MSGLAIALSLCSTSSRGWTDCSGDRQRPFLSTRQQKKFLLTIYNPERLWPHDAGSDQAQLWQRTELGLSCGHLPVFIVSYSRKQRPRQNAVEAVYLSATVSALLSII